LRLKVFRPSRKSLCTCAPKYTLNTYIGRCEHNCIYCYSSKFTFFRGKAKPNMAVVDNIEDLVKDKKKKLPVMLCSGTDPYQPLEKQYGATRRCVEVLAKHGFPIFIFTKSNLVVRDVDELNKTNAMVAMTITTVNPEKAKMIEPEAPSPSERLSGLRELHRKGVKTVARIDPIIPMLTDDEHELTSLLEALAKTGVKHITSATLKTVAGFFPRLRSIDPGLHTKLRPLYMKGKLAAGYRYLPPDYRRELMAKVKRLATEANFTFGACREGFPDLNTASCDGANYFWNNTP
jgi:DNA repair photolyase